MESDNIKPNKSKWRNKLFRQDTPIIDSFQSSSDNPDVVYIEQKLKKIRKRKRYRENYKNIEPLQNIYELDEQQDNTPIEPVIENMKNFNSSGKPSTPSPGDLKFMFTQFIDKTNLFFEYFTNIIYYIPLKLNKIITQLITQYVTIFSNLDNKNNPPDKKQINHDISIIVQILYVIICFLLSMFAVYNWYYLLVYTEFGKRPVDNSNHININFEWFTNSNIEAVRYLGYFFEIIFQFCIIPTQIIDQVLFSKTTHNFFTENTKWRIISFFILFFIIWVFLSILFLFMMTNSTIASNSMHIISIIFMGIIFTKWLCYALSISFDDIYTATDTVFKQRDNSKHGGGLPIPIGNVMNAFNKVKNVIPVEDVSNLANPKMIENISDAASQLFGVDNNSINKLNEAIKSNPSSAMDILEKEATNVIKNGEARLKKMAEPIVFDIMKLWLKTNNPIIYYVLCFIYFAIMFGIALISINTSMTIAFLYLFIYSFFGLVIYGGGFKFIIEKYKEINRLINENYRENIGKKEENNKDVFSKLAKMIATQLFKNGYNIIFSFVCLYGFIESFFLQSQTLKMVNGFTFGLLFLILLAYVVYSKDEPINVTVETPLKKENVHAATTSTNISAVNTPITTSQTVPYVNDSINNNEIRPDDVDIELSGDSNTIKDDVPNDFSKKTDEIKGKVADEISSGVDELKGKVADKFSSEVDELKGKVADKFSSEVSNAANTISSQLGKKIPDVGKLASFLPDIGKFAKLIPN